MMVNILFTLGSQLQGFRAAPLRAMVEQNFAECHEPKVDHVVTGRQLELSAHHTSAFIP